MNEEKERADGESKFGFTDTQVIQQQQETAKHIYRGTIFQLCHLYKNSILLHATSENHVLFLLVVRFPENIIFLIVPSSYIF